VLRSGDPLDPPALRPGYLREPADLDTLVRGVELALAIGGEQPLAAAARQRHAPAVTIGSTGLTGSLRRDIGTRVDTMFHPVGTWMGVDESAVVDPELTGVRHRPPARRGRLGDAGDPAREHPRAHHEDH